MRDNIVIIIFYFIDGRVYPYADIANSSDLLYVMDYDTQSQIFGACIAGANAPFAGMIRGIQRYLDIGVPPNKLVLGVPWYGYRYTCLSGSINKIRMMRVYAHSCVVYIYPICNAVFLYCSFRH